MFSNILEKLYADVKDVKEILLADISRAERDITKHEYKRVNFKAGSHIRKHFQTVHDDIHQLNTTNGILAERVAQDIQVIHATCLTQSKNLTDMATLFQIISSVLERCNDQLETLKVSFESIELGLLNLEETIEQIDKKSNNVPDS